MTNQSHEQLAAEEAAQHLVDLVAEYGRLDSHLRDGEAGQALLAQIRAMGYAASFFGGYAAQSALCKAAESIDRTSGYWINYMWQGIAGWMP